MASRIFSIGRTVKAATAAVVAMVAVFPWQSPALSQAQESTKPAAAGVWAESVVMSGKPADMGKNAGSKLKEACKDRKPDLVLLFDFKYLIKVPEEKKAILDGVAESFDKKIICGSTIHGPSLNNTVPSGAVGVLAFGGVKATPVKVAPEKGKEEAAYTTLAESLRTPYTVLVQRLPALTLPEQLRSFDRPRLYGKLLCRQS